MAWRPTEYLLEGELDNSTPNKVTGWMRFAGLKDKVTFDLEGNFHRDIRGAKIQFTGDGREDDPEAKGYMASFAEHQTGKVGDMTAGGPPVDYVAYPYLEVYSDENGRIVIELDRDQVQVIGRPIPACESDPISRAEQQANMAEFLNGLSVAAGVPAITVGSKVSVISDPKFTHWVVEQGQIIGEAHSVEPAKRGMSHAYVRLFNLADCAEHGYIETAHLRPKNGRSPN